MNSPRGVLRVGPRHRRTQVARSGSATIMRHHPPRLYESSKRRHRRRSRRVDGSFNRRTSPRASRQSNVLDSGARGDRTAGGQMNSWYSSNQSRASAST